MIQGETGMDGRGEGLKPCPFCPGEVHSRGNGYMYHEGEQHGCPLGYCAFTEETWNRRAPTVSTPAPSPALPAELEAMESTGVVHGLFPHQAKALFAYIRSLRTPAGPAQGVEAQRYLEAIFGKREDSNPVVAEFLEAEPDEQHAGFTKWAAKRALALLPRAATWTNEEIRAGRERAELIDKEIGWSEPQSTGKKEEA